MERELSQESVAIKFEVKLNPKDIYLYNLFFLKSKLSLFIVISLMTLIVGTIMISAGGELFQNFFLFIPAFLLVITPISVYLYAKKHEKEYGEPRTYTVDEKGISFDSETIQATNKWSKFKDFRQNKNYLFLFLWDKSALVFPVRCFEGEQEIEKFKSFIPPVIKNKKPKGNFHVFSLVVLYLMVFLVLVGLISYFSGPPQ
jgi:hypothetical protein